MAPCRAATTARRPDRYPPSPSHPAPCTDAAQMGPGWIGRHGCCRGSRGPGPTEPRPPRRSPTRSTRAVTRARPLRRPRTPEPPRSRSPYRPTTRSSSVRPTGAADSEAARRRPHPPPETRPTARLPGWHNSHAKTARLTEEPSARPLHAWPLNGHQPEPDGAGEIDSHEQMPRSQPRNPQPKLAVNFRPTHCDAQTARARLARIPRPIKTRNPSSEA